MRTCVLMLGCLLATASLAQSTTTRREVWEWKDANGVTHYSDYPAPGARKIVLVGSTPTAVAPSTPAAAPTSQPRTAAATQYKSLQISSPEQDAAFFGTDAEIVVRLRSEPALGPGDRLVTYLDGNPLATEDVYEHRLTGLSRGAHSLLAAIVNTKGAEVIRSAVVTFHVQQPSTIDNSRNKGPALRPQPKPTPKPATPKS